MIRFDLIELHAKMMENRKRKYQEELHAQINPRGAAEPDFKARIASATNLLNSKYSDGTKMFNDREVSYYSGLNPYFVQIEKARIAKRDRYIRRFLATGRIVESEEGGYFAISK